MDTITKVIDTIPSFTIDEIKTICNNTIDRMGKELITGRIPVYTMDDYYKRITISINEKIKEKYINNEEIIR